MPHVVVVFKNVALQIMANHAEEDTLNTESTTDRLVGVGNISTAALSWNQVSISFVYKFFLQYLLV